MSSSDPKRGGHLRTLGPITVLVVGGVMAAPALLAMLVMMLLGGVVSASFSGGAEADPAGAVVAGPWVGSITAQGWTHPIPGMVTYQGNYGQWRGDYAHAGEDLSGGCQILCVRGHYE